MGVLIVDSPVFGGTASGTLAGAPEFTGNPVFSGDPDFSGGVGLTGPTLTVGTEAANVIAVTVAAPKAEAVQYLAEVFEADMLHALVGAFTMAETGDGAEVSTTAKPSLLFTCSAAGAATLSVTDVAGASGKTVYLRLTRSRTAAAPPLVGRRSPR